MGTNAKSLIKTGSGNREAGIEYRLIRTEWVHKLFLSTLVRSSPSHPETSAGPDWVSGFIPHPVLLHCGNFSCGHRWV
jgi:hypothetical protein